VGVQNVPNVVEGSSEIGSINVCFVWGVYCEELHCKGIFWVISFLVVGFTHHVNSGLKRETHFAAAEFDRL
jgi:hypothetical protein